MGLLFYWILNHIRLIYTQIIRRIVFKTYQHKRKATLTTCYSGEPHSMPSLQASFFIITGVYCIQIISHMQTEKIRHQSSLISFVIGLITNNTNVEMLVILRNNQKKNLSITLAISCHSCIDLFSDTVFS